MARLLAFLRWLFCRHPQFDFVRNIYGDEINAACGKRSIWRCAACGKVQQRDQLHDTGDLRGIAGPLPEHGWD